MQKLEDHAFVLLVVLATVAFALVLRPFFGTVLWGLVVTILFHPLFLRLNASFGGRRSLAAAVTVLLVILIVIVPLLLVSVALGQQASDLYGRVSSGEMDFGLYLQRILDAMPGWARQALDWFGLSDMDTVREKLRGLATQAGQAVAGSAIGIGLGAFDFALGLGVMLYLLFFLLRDGEALLKKVKATVPLRAEQKSILLKRISQVVRATVKGGVIVAMVQGALGGFALWVLGIPAALLWAVVMAFLSLLPAIGAALVWGPVALYLLATGAVGQGVFLILFGVVVIGLVDNLLRPFLVGKSTRLPDYVVLVSTLGGIEVFGLNGFVVGPLLAVIFLVSWDIFRRSGTDEAA
ncbi:MAG TPA: AI-2E family transporter [Rhizomicrobium sp.]|nr:AI-2E family transporter [Rhizomicrobium sp.]